ncbi:DUF2147 domain-containing protein [Candidatus Paracaedibacter symbiosus]|uniref:DUF2147 domain-containing protein n=1 Tax=Candidatus Paracaedibacter symbiosus TaxID=244582 RepID=UPI00068A861A|nr:DUF2147 domain-containing protein [Candidatus Paracaedibacter symbiosus]
MKISSTGIVVLSVFGFMASVQAKTPEKNPQHQAANLPNPFSPDGYWQTERSEGKLASKIHVYQCGEKTVCGKIVALEEPNDPTTGKPKVDPEGRPLMGMEIMKNFKNSEGMEWTDGEIYDPKEGKTYSAQFEIAEAGKVMKLTGYVLITLLGKTQTWHRIGKDELLK